MLAVRDLAAGVDGRPILRGLSLSVDAGEVHAIMGPNGSGKSTFAQLLAGREGYEHLGGTVEFMGQDLLSMEPDARAAAGLFLGFQYPVEIPGVSNLLFLRTAINAQRRQRGEAEISGAEFMRRAREEARLLGLDIEMLKRGVNMGFSGGEKKRSEAFQLAMLQPRLALLDETDSGLDIDALRVVAEAINRFRSNETAIIVITHYQRLLDLVRPDRVHVLAGGRIVRSGGPELALELEREGYGELAA